MRRPCRLCWRCPAVCHPLISLPRRPQGRDALVFSFMPRCLRHGSTCPALGDPHLTTSCQTRPAAGRASTLWNTYPVRNKDLRRGSHPARHGTARLGSNWQFSHSCVSLSLQECTNVAFSAMSASFLWTLRHREKLENCTWRSRDIRQSGRALIKGLAPPRRVVALCCYVLKTQSLVQVAGLQPGKIKQPS